MQSDQETLITSPKTESAASSAEWTNCTRSQRLMSQMLSTLIPTSTEDIFRKYPALLDVPFISMSEILVTREIGSGSFGRVFHGIFSFQDVAVKQLTVRNFRDEIDIYDNSFLDDGNDEADKKARQAAETLLALEKEVGMLKRISFPKVVGFYGVCFEPAAIVSEYCARGSLFDLIARARTSPRIALEMSWERRLRLASDAAIGMNFLHNRMDPIIHRDLKSPNLLVDQHYVCKVADFNTAGFVNATEITKSQANNPRWLAPEIADGKPHTPASDVYPFGIILWELMTWLRPFEMHGEEMTTYNILLGIVRDKLRPEIIPNHKLKGGPCPVYDEYVKLMKECWDQEPSNRPDFREIHDRLRGMICRAVEMEKEKPSSPRISKIQIIKPRAISPEPNPSRSPRSESPFSKRDVDGAVTVKTREFIMEQIKSTETVPQSEDPAEQCLTSPFQNGPPSLGGTSMAVRASDDKSLRNPPSFANWSVQVGRPTTVLPSGLFEYSDVVQPHSVVEQTPAQRRWRLVRREFELDDLAMSPTNEYPRRALEKWDSVRTALFGAPTSENFEEQFGSFLKGDETEELKKRLNDIENKGSPGLRILKALMELRQAKEQETRNEGSEEEESQVLESKPSGWCLVKHLMLINLPTAVHPMWELLSQNIKPRRSADSNLDSIAENSLTSVNGGGDRERQDEKRKRAQELWKLVKSAFLEPADQRSRPAIHPCWQQILEQFSPTEKMAEIVPPTPVAPHPQPSSSDSPPVERRRKPSKWNLLRQTFVSDVVEKNWDFLTLYAKTEVMKMKDMASKTPSTVRKLAIVDEEPPSEEKWHVIRSLLLAAALGEEWEKVKEKAKKHIGPPHGADWEVFRWLFFENKKLRSQPHWNFIKDLFLKTEAPVGQNPE